jgi:hypothetical protein
MASATKTSRVRVGGSGFTIFTYGGQALTFCQQVSHTSPSFVGQGASAIQPMDEPYPVEIIVPIAAGMGTLVLNLFDLFGQTKNGSKVWDRLGASLGGNSNVNLPFGTIRNSGIGNVSTALQIGSGPFNGLGDIVDIAIKQAVTDPSKLNITKYIRPLPTYGQNATPYSEEYHGCVITDVVDGEQIEVGTLEVLKQITVNYTYLTRNGQQPSAFNLRAQPL